jgi:hypothetical protein
VAAAASSNSPAIDRHGRRINGRLRGGQHRRDRFKPLDRCPDCPSKQFVSRRKRCHCSWCHSMHGRLCWCRFDGYRYLIDHGCYDRNNQPDIGGCPTGFYNRSAYSLRDGCVARRPGVQRVVSYRTAQRVNLIPTWNNTTAIVTMLRLQPTRQVERNVNTIGAAVRLSHRTGPVSPSDCELSIGALGPRREQ